MLVASSELRALRFGSDGGKLKYMHENATNPEFMQRAIAIALENVRNGGGPFGAVIAREGRIFAEGVNRVTATNDPTAHAEVVAIRAACAALGAFQLKGCDLYTTCEPCPMCLGAIYWARPARVFYASSAGDAAAAGFDDALYLRRALSPARRARNSHDAAPARRFPRNFHRMEKQRKENRILIQRHLRSSGGHGFSRAVLPASRHDPSARLKSTNCPR